MSQWWFYAPQCPVEDECTHKAFKRAKCAGPSEEAVREKVKKHLMRSNNHKMDPDDAAACARTATIKKEEWSAEEIAQWKAPQKGKRQKTHHGDEPKGNTRLTPEHVKEVVANAIAALRQGDHDADDNSLDGDSEEVRIVHPNNMLAHRPQLPEGRVTMRYTQLKGVLDCLSRAENGCRGAQKVLQQAAHAFADEAKNIASAADDIRRLINCV